MEGKPRKCLALRENRSIEYRQLNEISLTSRREGSVHVSHARAALAPFAHGPVNDQPVYGLDLLVRASSLRVRGPGRHDERPLCAIVAPVFIVLSKQLEANEV